MAAPSQNPRRSPSRLRIDVTSGADSPPLSPTWMEMMKEPTHSQSARTATQLASTPDFPGVRRPFGSDSPERRPFTSDSQVRRPFTPTLQRPPSRAASTPGHGYRNKRATPRPATPYDERQKYLAAAAAAGIPASGPLSSDDRPQDPCLDRQRPSTATLPADSPRTDGWYARNDEAVAEFVKERNEIVLAEQRAARLRAELRRPEIERANARAMQATKDSAKRVAAKRAAEEEAKQEEERSQTAYRQEQLRQLENKFKVTEEERRQRLKEAPPTIVQVIRERVLKQMEMESKEARCKFEASEAARAQVMREAKADEIEKTMALRRVLAEAEKAMAAKEAAAKRGRQLTEAIATRLRQENKTAAKKAWDTVHVTFHKEWLESYEKVFGTSGKIAWNDAHLDRKEAQLSALAGAIHQRVVSHQESALAEHQRQLNAEGNAADASIEALDAAKAQLWEQACEACEARPRKMYASVDAHIRKVWGNNVQQTAASARSAARETVHAGKYFSPPTTPQQMKPPKMAQTPVDMDRGQWKPPAEFYQLKPRAGLQADPGSWTLRRRPEMNDVVPTRLGKTNYREFWWVGVQPTGYPTGPGSPYARGTAIIPTRA